MVHALNKVIITAFRNIQILAQFKITLSFIFSQSMIVFGPLATIFLNPKRYYEVSDILSNRNNVEYFISQIESQNNE